MESNRMVLLCFLLQHLGQAIEYDGNRRVIRRPISDIRTRRDDEREQMMQIDVLAVIDARFESVRRGNVNVRVNLADIIIIKDLRTRTACVMTAVYRLLKTGKCPTSLRLQHMKLLIDYFEGCPFGDQPGIISNEQTTCKGSVLAKPFLCYDEQTALMCCKSCSLHYRSKPGCEYGDKEGKCSSINLLHCLFDESTCCETYAQLDKTLSALRLPVFITCVLLVLLTIAVITHCIRRKSQNKGHRQTNENCVDTLPTNDVSNTCCLASAADSKSENIVSNRKRTPVGQSSFEMKPSTRETIGYDIQADENEAPDPTNDFTERGNAQQIMIDRFLSNWNKYIDNNGKQLTESRYIPSSEADLSVVQPTGTRNSRIWSIDML